MTETAVARCRRTAGIVEAVLDGNEAILDRAHLAGCATCSREVERAIQFTRSLSTTAAEAAEGIPDPTLLGRDPARLGGQTGRFTLRILTLAGAVAAGLVIATVIGSRALAPTGRGPSIFGPSAAAQERLSRMDMACGQDDAVIDCKSVAKDHVHRVRMTLDDAGQVVRVEARIDGTNGKPLELRGADVMFARFASAVLTPEMRSQAVNWVDDAFESCGATCAANIDNLHLELRQATESVVLSLTQR